MTQTEHRTCSSGNEDTAAIRLCVLRLINSSGSTYTPSLAPAALCRLMSSTEARYFWSCVSTSCDCGCVLFVCEFMSSCTVLLGWPSTKRSCKALKSNSKKRSFFINTQTSHLCHFRKRVRAAALPKEVLVVHVIRTGRVLVHAWHCRKEGARICC